MRVLVTGANGQLGQDVVAALRHGSPQGADRSPWWRGSGGNGQSLEVVGASHRELSVEDRLAVLEVFEGLRPEVVIHTGAFTAVDACEQEPERALAVNALGTRHLAEGARRFGAHLLYVSTDYVFDGTLERPYHEWDQPHPLSVYGLSKLGGERECPEGSTIVRSSWLWSTHGNNMVATALALAEGNRRLRFVDDQRGCPTFTADLATAVAALALDRRGGLYHVTNQGATTWFGFVRTVLELAGYHPDRVEAISTSELEPPRPARRPTNSVLDNAALRLAKLPLLAAWHDALRRGMEVLAAESKKGPHRR